MQENLTKIESAAANTILDWAKNRNSLITHLQIQKLLYFSCGYYLAEYDESMIQHEFEAWKYGPVLPQLYSVLKNYGDNPITRLTIHHEDNKPYLYRKGSIFKAVDITMKNFANSTTWDLVEITHDDNGPWDQTKKKYGNKAKISNELIKDYFKNNIGLFK